MTNTRTSAQPFRNKVETVTALYASGVADQEQIARQHLSASENRKPSEHNLALIALRLRQLAIGLSEDNSDIAEQICGLLN